MIVADAAPPVDAQAPFLVGERVTPHETFVDVTPHGAKCPGLDYRRKAKSVSIERCRDKPFAEQLDTLREMVAYMRGIDPAFDAVRIMGGVDYYSYPELAKRLVEHAQKVPYDKKLGLHKYVVEAAASADLLSEIAVIFQRKPKLIGVEKCSSGRANGKGEIAEFLRAAGATGTAEIPVGCAMGWIELSR